MLRVKPRLTYCGLTIVLSNPSRFDIASLLSGMGGNLFNDHCLRPDYNVMQCDIRLMEDKTSWWPNTKCILVLGEGAMHHYFPWSVKNSLGELRGSPLVLDGIAAICSYFPQDAADARAWEQQHNPLSKDYTIEDDNQDEKEEYDSVKKHGSTKRANYAFWLKADTNKCKILLRNNGQIPASKYPAPQYHLSPSTSEVVDLLTNTKGKWLYFDMETDYEEANMQCFSFSFDGCNIYGCVVLDYNYKHSGISTFRIMVALAVAIRDNIIVAHNGATFDFLVLAFKYKIAINKAYDTLLAMHRCFPDVEKSLGHAVSYFTWERFHKDENSVWYMTEQQQKDRVAYCCKDVYTMFLVHKGIEAHAKTVPGLQDSIDTVQSMIKPYLVTSLQGIKVDTEHLSTVANEADRLMFQYDRMIKILIGEIGLIAVRSVVRKAGMFAASNTQCVEYFHNLLGYDVVARSLKTKEPSLGKKAIFKLRLKYANPVLDLVIAFRTVQKEFGTYKFIPWVDHQGLQGSITALEELRQCKALEAQQELPSISGGANV